MSNMEEETIEDQRALRTRKFVTDASLNVRHRVHAFVGIDNSNDVVMPLILGIAVELIRGVMGRIGELSCEAPSSTKAEGVTLSPEDRTTVRSALLKSKDACTMNPNEYENKYYPEAHPLELTRKLDQALKILG